MKKIFEKVNIGGIDMRNRTIRSATTLRLSDGCGGATPQLIARYQELSEGEIGLIIFEDTAVNSYPSTPKHLLIECDTRIADLRLICSNIHRQGGRIIMQDTYYLSWWF